MAGHAPTIALKPLPGAKIAIISSLWHLDICNDLIAGAKRALAEAQVGEVEVQFVPGSFEIHLLPNMHLKQALMALLHWAWY